MAEAWGALGMVVVAAGLFIIIGYAFWKTEQADQDTQWRARNNVPGAVSRRTGRVALAQSGESQAMTRDEVIELTRSHAIQANIPERVGLALIWAESNFDPNAYRHTSPEDHSIGLGQQTFRWSEFWNGTYDAGDIANWKAAYSDPNYALQRAFIQMHALRLDDHLDWLCRYNKRSGVVAPSVRTRYQLGLTWADGYLAERGQMDTGFEFTGGFAQKAAELQEQGVDPGTPLTEEKNWDGVTVQVTTTGLFVYVSPGSPLFLDSL